MALCPTGSMVKAAEILEWAKENTDSAIHNYLIWDNEKAGHEHRLEQIRHLIRVHVVTVDRQPVMVSLSIDRSRPGGGYRLVDDVVAVPRLADIMLQDALRELERVEMRYRHLQELVHVWEAAKRARAAMSSGKTRGKPRSPEKRPTA